MLSFYNTPAGQAVSHKMPLLLQNTMTEVQKMMADMSPKLQQIQDECVATMKAAGE